MRSQQVFKLLREYESRNVTHLDPDGSWPIVWERARGVHVWDAEGKRYLDLTAAFGVAAAGHANPRVVRAGQAQMGKLLHAMGDVHPHALKAQLARELSRLTFERWTACGTRGSAPRGRSQERPLTGKVIFSNSGFEAVESALKTALLATGKPGVIAFAGAYHGLGYGALNATHRGHFRSPFRSQLGEFGHFAPFPTRASELPVVEREIRGLFRGQKIGAILVEPVQVRGGINIPPAAFLPMLRTLATQHQALLVLDEIYTGFGRTGTWFACEHSGTVPDMICLGKGLTGGFPLSACVGRADVMDTAWPASSGEAIHTSTFLGHPVGCAMVLANMAEIRRRKLVGRSARLGASLLGMLARLRPAACLPHSIRGIGLLAGIELRRRDGSPASAEAIDVVKRMLERGFILLPEGEHGNVVGLTPPLVITEKQMERTIRVLAEVLTEIRAAVRGRSTKTQRGRAATKTRLSA